MHVAQYMKNYRLPEQDRKQQIDEALEEREAINYRAKESLRNMNDREHVQLLTSNIYNKLSDSLKEYAKTHIKNEFHYLIKLPKQKKEDIHLAVLRMPSDDVFAYIQSQKHTQER